MKPKNECQQMLYFLRKHGACAEGAKWASESCLSLKEVWETAKPDWLIWVALRPGVLTDRELRLFAVFCATSALALVKNPDPRIVAAIKVATDSANGLATADELAAAYAARAAADAAADAAARAAAYAATEAADAAARAAAEAAQSQWLRENTKPNFS